MKKTIFLYAIIVSLTGACATQTTKEYVDKRDAANLADSKSYTDVKVAEIARDLPTKYTLKPLVEDIIKTNIFPWAREVTKPTYTPEEVGALPDTTFIPTKVSDIDNDLEFVQKSVFDTSVDGKMSMTNRSGSAYIGWMDPNIFFGVGSFSFGKGCKVDQYFSFASGFNTQAYGKYSHSNGRETNATGEASHAEGYRTTAEGHYSHAEGNSTTASGFYSHAEGNNTTASGVYSHAEGYNTTASVSCSHAEGDSTTASGFYSHAEGNNTTASGFYSHAEGSSTIAGGLVSHADGFKSYATNNYSFAWNGSTKNTYGSHGDGTFNINPVGGVDGFYIGEKNLKTIITEVASGGGGIWDADLQVWWTPVMSNGKLTYQATTNVNLNAGN